MVALPGQTIASGPDSPPAAEGGLAPVQVVLEITRGRTRFRSRPVTGSRFLIGAGITCDLRLGAGDVPAIHSILTIHGGEVHLEAINPVPALVVNGKTVRETTLCDGDTIAIGEVELRAKMSVGKDPVNSQAVIAKGRAEALDDVPLSDLSAVDLIDRIEAEEQMIDNFEERRRTGAAALTQALFSRAHRKAERPAEDETRKRSVPAPHFLSKRPQVLAARGRQDNAPAEVNLQNELEQLGKQLATLSQELKHNAQRASAREAEFATATDVLMETQQKLISRFEMLMSHVEQLQQQKQAPSPMNRAIA